MKKIGVGIASFGLSGQVFHGPLLKSNPHFRIHTIYERSKNISAKEHPDARLVRYFEELIEDPDVELIIVNSPDNYHFEMCRDALMAGNHVVVEKPFVRNSREGNELIKLAEEKGLLLSVFQNRRWDGDFLTVRKIIEEGLLGRLVEYEAHFDRFRNFIPAGTWKEKAGSGSIIFNLGSHLIDQALVLFGMPEYVYGDLRAIRSGTEVDDAFTLMLGYDDVKVTLKASYLVKEPGPRYLVHGTEGSYLKHGIDPQEEALKQGILPGGAGWGREPREEWGILNTQLEGREYNGPLETLPGNYPEYYENIAKAIRDGTSPEVSAVEGNMVIRVIEAAIESNDSGRRIQVKS